MVLRKSDFEHTPETKFQPPFQKQVDIPKQLPHNRRRNFCYVVNDTETLAGDRIQRLSSQKADFGFDPELISVKLTAEILVPF